jgi:hypothetical protein
MLPMSASLRYKHNIEKEQESTLDGDLGSLVPLPALTLPLTLQLCACF